MKILAIRGKNLASLAAEFVVDFQSEPLATAGLYAITGPTGSGKSTLLDALCLALYESTPRLAKASTKGESIPDVGDNSVTPSDPRTILRRGAAEGFAEVDFVGSDGVSYRSRWTVRRSRSKADGKLQKSELSLQRIADGQQMGDHSKTETLRLIEACIGLNFEQFTRAVLLAQNDFAAFLKASDDERAELLQTLTGTETFSVISMQAFARMKTEKEQLDRMQAQLKVQEPLAPELRAEKDGLLQAQTEAARTFGQQQAVIEGHLRWYLQWDQLRAAEADASQKRDIAVAENLAAAPRYEQLGLVERVQPARPLWSELQRLTNAVATTARTEAQSSTELAQCLIDAAKLQSNHETARQQLANAEEAKVRAQPDIDGAKALDASIATLNPQFEAAAKAQADAQKHVETETLQRVDTNKRMESATRELGTTQEWLSKHAVLKPLAEGWQRWDALFSQGQDLLVRQNKGTAEVNDLLKQASANAKSVAKAQAELAHLTESSKVATEKLASLINICDAVDAEKLARDKKTLEESRDHIQSASQLLQRHVQAQRQGKAHRDQQQIEAAALATCELELLEGSRSQPVLEGELQSAEQAFQLAKLAASKNAESMRVNLQMDQPCPVCGAIEHPYATHSPDADSMLQGLQDHVKEKQAALRHLQDRIVLAVAGKASAEKAIEQIARDLAQLEADGDVLLTEWSMHVLHAKIDAVPEPDRAKWLVRRQERVKRDLTQLSQQEAVYRENLKLKDAAQSALNKVTKTVDHAKVKLNSLSTTGATASQAIDAGQRHLSQIAQQLDSIQDQLDGGFVDKTWRRSWTEAPDAFVEQCRKDAHAWSEKLERLTTLKHGIESIKVESAACDIACNQATRQFDMQSALRSKIETELQTYRAGRGDLFGGRAIADVESDLNVAIDSAKGVLAKSQVAIQEIQGNVARLQEAVRQSASQLEQHRSAMATAAALLDEWLGEFNLQRHTTRDLPDILLDELKSLLEISTAWSTAERDSLQVLSRAVDTAQAVLDTRKRTLTDHEAGKSTTEDAETLRDNLAKVTESREAAADLLSALKLEIGKDDERLLASASLRVDIEKQTATSHVWSQLSELIGSADGKKFRNFAQQLTLDILLAYGNRHLQSLTSRYRLERIKDCLGLLVVDQDMGDEIRSVHSLSGGESFLVSLALALGLASLSSHRVRVESLFIDEGFGSLDADSLRVAMDALDNLQAQGRKVGVISHVQEMSERIGTRVQVQRQASGLSRIVVE